MNPITEILPGRLTYDELKKAKADQFAPFRGGEGVKHVDRKYVLYKDVDYGTTEDNPVRVNGSSGVAVTKLADSRRQGIDPSAELPCVSINKNEDTKTPYKGENGMTRMKADRYNGYGQYGGDGVWMDVVEFFATEGRSAEYNRIVYLHKRNSALPQDSNTINDIVKTATDLIYSGDLELTQDAVEKFVYNAAPDMETRVKNQAVKSIVKEEDIPTSTISWTYSEAQEWLEKRCVDDYQVDYCLPYRYFAERVYPVLNEFYKTVDSSNPLGRKINVTQWFDNSGDSEKSVLGARISQAQKWEHLRKIGVALSKYMMVNDWQLPFELETAFPQIKDGDDKDIQERLVKLPKIEIKED